MVEYDEIIQFIKREIKIQGYCRKKLSKLLWDWFDCQKKNKTILNRFDQVLFEKNIIVYTRSHNIKEGKENWDWQDLKTNSAYITFIKNTKSNKNNLSSQNLLKMYVVNEPIPTVALFEKFALKAKEILICSAYVDEEMASLLADIAKRKNLNVRFIADINFNSNPYKRGIIRSKIESVGTFRTLAGTNDEDGLMHLKLYVFYSGNNDVEVFTTSANFTASAWKFKNEESPVTIQSGNTNDTQIAVMVNAAERIWKKSENLNHMKKFNQGDRVSHHAFGIGEIFKVTEDIAQVVFIGNNFQTVKVSDLQLIIDPLQMIEEGIRGQRDTIHRAKAKFLAHYIYAQNSLTNEFYDFRIKPVPHQLLALKKAITSSHGGNLLFADDVGLGKTIEAGLVIQNTIRRIGEDKARVLIMCPAGLKWQWYEEMKDKFGLYFNVWKSHTVYGAEAFTGSFHGQNKIIASYHGMVSGDMEDAILRMIERYDLVVIDECHKFSNEATQWWKLARDLRENHKVEQLLLLSATPHSGDRNRFLNLLHLLDGDFFPKGTSTQDSLQKITQHEVIDEFVYRNDKLSVTDFNNKPLFKNVISTSIDVELTKEEQGFCELVVDYIKALNEAKQELQPDIQTQVGFVISVYRKMLASSWKNVFRSMQARYKYLLNQTLEEDGLDPVFDIEEEIEDEKEERDIANLMKEMKSSKIVSNELEYLEKIVNYGKELEKKNIDTKIQKLLELVNSPELADRKVIIFTQYVKTLEVIKKALGGKELVAEIQGSINVEDRKGQIEKFRKKVRFMIGTEAGGEGINLQFANTVINFDMPWNPARLQQRVGRVWRYGQDKDVNCYNFFVTNSISDQKVLERLNYRINEMVRNFLVPIEFNGVKQELHEALIYDTTMRVLGKVQEDESIEKMMGILDDELRDQRLKQAETRILAALHFVQLEQKDLAPSMGIQLEEIQNFYASRDINFIYQFAKSIAQSFGGDLMKSDNETYEFVNLNLTDIGLDNSIFQNKKYVFEQGKVGEQENGGISFFGFGDEFFNHLIEIARNQSFGGNAVCASIKLPHTASEIDGVALVSSSATSVVINNGRSENYSICSFISVKDGREIVPEHLFLNDWTETNMIQKPINKGVVLDSIAPILEIHKQKLQAFRHKEFILTSPVIESAVALF